MREIKFRAWDKEQSAWINGNQPIIFQTALGFPDSIELMQFTGLKDRNGKEIWEGDIVKYKYQDGSDEENNFDEHKSKIEFVEGQFYPRPHQIECEDYWYSYRLFDFEVIGNIWENPELLVK